MQFLRFCAATLAAACLICGCATRSIIVGQVRPPISPEAVHVYRVPPRHFERIAIIDSPAGTSWIFPDRPSMELGISRLREQAAALGANGILLQRVYDVSAGGLAIGVGGFGSSGHSFYGGAGDVGVRFIFAQVFKWKHGDAFLRNRLASLPVKRESPNDQHCDN